MFWKTTYLAAFFFPTGRSKEERCGRISCERPFLYVIHTIARLSSEGGVPADTLAAKENLSAPAQPYKEWHRSTAGSDTRVNLYRALCLITHALLKSDCIQLEQ